MKLLVAHEKKDLEPRSGWYSFPHSRLRGVKPNVRRRRYDKHGLELEYEDLNLGEMLTGEETKFDYEEK